ncbi:MAG: hypothetical protein DHS20C18_11510 [Saprospiraceae bacterium]|nr:MAG: hypothetical protein DHS20C18_11510 [Saprospiraceae bacterium]
MKNLLYFSVMILGLLLAACGSSQNVSKDGQANKVSKKASSNSVEGLESNMTLVDYVRRLPGVRVSGREGNYSVSIAGNVNSINSNIEPLYVLDGVPAGHDINNLTQMVTSTDINSVRVVKDGPSLAFYGVQGGNGVILIETKKK